MSYEWFNAWFIVRWNIPYDVWVLRLIERVVLAIYDYWLACTL